VRKAENLVLPAVACGIAAVLAAARLANVRQASAATPSGRPIEVRAEGFRSSGTCRACHPGQYASWHASYHRTMTQVATPSTVATPFDGVTVEAATGGPMQLEQRGQELWADFADPDATPSSANAARRIARRVVMTTGSHNQQIFWYATGNSRVLGQLPAIWLTAEPARIPRRAAVIGP